MDPRTRAIIARLLRNLGSRGEVEQYLKHYGADGRKVAVIQVAGEVLGAEVDDVASSLAFLAEVGLQPAVVHGARPQIEFALRERGLENAEGTGMGHAAVLDVARRVSMRTNNRLLEALERLGVRARSLSTGVFRGVPGTNGRFGLSGRPVAVDEEPVRWALQAGAVPVLSSLGESDEGQILSLDPPAAARALAGILRPHKLIFLRRTGGLTGPAGGVMSAVNLVEDFEGLVDAPELPGEVKSELSSLYELLMELPPESSVSFTSPGQLAKELFTHTGAGTLVRLGVRVQVYDSFRGVDEVKLRNLLEGCFRKALQESYFQNRRVHRIYLSDDYRATAVVLNIGAPIPYLDKFAVTEAAQGDGLGGSVWRRLRTEQRKLFWRARPDNPVNPWYFRNADGTFRGRDWVVFWYGFKHFEDAKDCVDRALSLPSTFYEPTPRSLERVDVETAARLSVQS